MGYSPYPSIPYTAFRQACRAYAPSRLIPAIAAASAALGEPPFPRTLLKRRPPWALAAAARESLVYGNEHRSTPVHGNAIDTLCRKFWQVHDELPGEADGTADLNATVSRFVYEQFPYQESISEELGRTHALLVEGLGDVRTQVIDQATLHSLLGMSLQDAVGAAILLYVGVARNRGIFDPAWLDQPNFTEVLKVYPRPNVESLLNRLTVSPEQYRADYARLRTSDPRLDRFAYNPLVRTPFIDVGGMPTAPVGALILRTVTPGGLYFPGVEQFGEAFTDDLGRLFEHYVGRQLSLIPGADVHPEIKYGKADTRSVDWLVVLPSTVLLVEVKSQRLTLGAKAGDSTFLKRHDQVLGHARRQIERTAVRIRGGSPAFSHVPSDRPLVGLVVTAEPFYSGNAHYLLKPSDDWTVPVAVAASRELEHLVVLGDRLHDHLQDFASEPIHTGVNLREVLSGAPKPRNPILDAAWEHYPIPDAD